MPTKKIKFNENEITIFEDAVIYKRGEYWQFRIWLTKDVFPLKQLARVRH
jgi:hypothetical protein